jgi:hypothetical protein
MANHWPPGPRRGRASGALFAIIAAVDADREPIAKMSSVELIGLSRALRAQSDRLAEDFQRLEKESEVLSLRIKLARLIAVAARTNREPTLASPWAGTRPG